MQNSKIKVTLNGAGINYRSEVNPNIAAVIIKLCLSQSTEKNNMEVGSTLIETPLMEEKISLGEYVYRYNPKTYPEKILAIASFQTKIKKNENFSPKDIRPLFRTIGEIPPKNFNRDFWITVSNRWIAQDDTHEFYVTSEGFKMLESGFSNKQENKKKRKSRKKKSIDRKENTEN